MRLPNRYTIARYLLDSFVLSFALAAAFFIRFDFSPDAFWWFVMAVHWPFFVVCEIAAMVLAGATRGAWRFVSMADVRRILIGLVLAHVPFVIERIIVGTSVDWKTRIVILPWGVIVMNLCLAVLGCIGVRVLRRMVFESELRKKSHSNHILVAEDRTLLIGDGTTCKQIIDSVRIHPELGILVVGIISDNVEEQSRRISNVPVLGNTGQIVEIAKKFHIDQAVLTEAVAESGKVRGIFNACAEIPLKTRIVPRMDDILSGTVDIGRMRTISVEDLLHRDPVQLDKAEISKFLNGKRILISGAGGSIGSEMCRQVLAFEPAELVLLERCELFLYEIERELKGKTTTTRIIPRLADICDAERIDEIFEECTPQVIFHAAAYKHVPMLEYNPGESIRNNVEGTALMAEMAVKHNCDAFVMISTDKAVNPTSIMGTSKRIAELYIQGMSTLNKTRFCGVRFGNVLGSTGSVLPLFRQQLANGGPLTVTHPDMVRYFMTIPEAAQLVMQAGTMAHSGEIFVLDMGEPVKIVDLARDLIRLSGKTERDIPIEFTGIRPGEKLFEELGFNEEHMDRTVHPKIYVGKLQPVALDWIRAQIETLKPLRDCQDNARVRAAMKQLVPEMQEPAK